MNTKSILAILLAAMLLVDSLNAVKWQGTCSGMNNTVLTEIWTGLSTKVDTAISISTNEGYNSLTKVISDRLNDRWDPAWNVVLALTSKLYDVILYGYAFRNQWMWFKGVPNDYLPTARIVSLIVWKDYNCQAWKTISDYSTSSFTPTQKAFIKSEAERLTQTQLENDIWEAAHSMMTNIQDNSEFSSGGYTVIFAQDGSFSTFYGNVCRVGYKHYS